MLKVLVGTTAQGEELKWVTISGEEIASLASTAPLFGGARTFILEGAINSERQEEFVDMAEVFVKSPHTFIFIEEKLLKVPTTALEKAGAKIEVVKKPTGKDRGFDQFGLTHALAAHDKKRLWLALTEAFRKGEKAEAVAGLLAWKARQMGDVVLSRKLTFMYHDSHRGAGDLALLLERFALTL